MSRRKKPEDDHENHERWLVSYADFITLLFAFFVVMYSLSSVNEGKYRVLSNSLLSAFRSVNVNDSGQQIVVPPIASVAAMPPPPERVIQPDEEQAERELAVVRLKNMADEIRQVLEPLTRDGQVNVTEGVNGIVVEINASVLFPPGEAALGSTAGAALRAVAQVLVGSSFPITIEGHTDNLPISTVRFPSNWELSAVRASSVVRLFVETGIRGDRLTAAGYGDQRPISDNFNEQGRARNRRVTILIESMVPEERPVAPGRIRSNDPIRSILPRAAVPG
jgi:chemotaxis protein MotB